MSENGAISVVPMRELIAEEIRALLGRRKIGVTELARRIRVSQPYLSRRLSGDVAIDVDDLALIAEVLGVEVTDLIPSSGQTAEQRGDRILTTAGHTPVGQGHNLKRESVRPPESTRPNGHPRHQTPHPSTRRPVRMSLAHKQSGD